MEADVDYLVRRISPDETIAALTEFPRYFEIETVNACQAKCPMCTIADWNRKDGVMKDDLFEKIVGEICGHPEVKRVHLYRDGEPLLDNKLADRILKFKLGGVREVGISTNVELLDEKRALAILQAGLDEIILSIDSVWRPRYEQIRVGLNFAKVLHNAHQFFDLRDKLRSSCRIRVRMIRQELNAEEWDSGYFEREWHHHLKSGDTIEAKDIHDWGGQLQGFKLKPADTSKPCLFLWSSMVIFADGSVPLCNVDYNKKYPLGNVRTATIAELWQSHEQNRRRVTHRQDIEMCKNCTVWAEKIAA